MDAQHGMMHSLVAHDMMQYADQSCFNQQRLLVLYGPGYKTPVSMAFLCCFFLQFFQLNLFNLWVAVCLTVD